MDCDCCTFKMFSQGYPVRVNVQFVHSADEVEKEASIKLEDSLHSQGKPHNLLEGSSWLIHSR